MRKRSFFRRVLMVPLALVALGLVGLWVFGTLATDISAGEIGVSQFLRDLSIATIIIGALGLLVVLHGEYLKGLNDEALAAQSVSGMREFASRVATNQAYRGYGVIEQVYSDVVPLISKVYREDVRETTEMNELLPDQVMQRMHLPSGQITSARPVTVSTTQTTFSFVAPFADGEIVENHEWVSVLRKIPGMPVDLYVKLRVRQDDGTWKNVALAVAEGADDKIQFRAVIPIRFRGQTRVELWGEEYDNGPIRYRTMKMSHLTRGLDLTVVSKTPMNLDAEVYGLLTGGAPNFQKTSTSIGVRYDGWLLPNDGYVVYGAPKEDASHDQQQSPG